MLCVSALSGLNAADEKPKEFRHAITFVHPHTATTVFTKASPTEPVAMQPTDVQLPQTTDFGTFRLQYAYQNLWGGFAPWVALGFGILAGISYRFDLWKAFYL